ncbi:hypothetical protein FP744_10000060 [Trichoderma asperellum]
MSKLQDSSIPISVTSLPLKHSRQRNQNISPRISLLAGATAGAIEAATTGTACKAGVRFLTFDSIKKIISDGDGKLSPARGLLAGMAAGAVESVIAITPTERIKTALIDDARMPTRQYKGGIHALQVIIREHGLNEVYRGLVSTTIKQSATSAVRMGTYNSLKENVSPRLGGFGNNPVATFGLGAIAGIITVFATQPFDTIKTRTQGATGITVSAAMRDIFQDGGVRAFWSGSSMRLGRLVLSGGIVFTVYESISAALTRTYINSS